MLKRYIGATLAAGFVMWLVAGVWHEVIMARFYAEQAHASHEGTGIILVAFLILALLMNYLYARSSKGQRPWLDGLIFGVVIGLLWVFPHELAMVGAHGESLAYVFKNALWHMVEQGIGGLIIGLIHGRSPVTRREG